MSLGAEVELDMVPGTGYIPGLNSGSHFDMKGSRTGVSHLDLDLDIITGL